MSKIIKISQNKETIVDDQDYELLNQWKWHFKEGYVSRTINGKRIYKIYMHRVISNCPEGRKVDHINGNGLDNRRENLRIVTDLQNAQNRKIGKNRTFKGVYFDREKTLRKWRAKINADKRNIHIGYFSTPQEAAKAYNEAAIKLHGIYASLNPV